MNECPLMSGHKKYSHKREKEKERESVCVRQIDVTNKKENVKK